MRTLRINDNKNEYNAREMINEFLILQEQKGIVRTTIKAHLYALNALHKHCKGIPTEVDLRRCLAPNLSNSYYNKRLSTYRQFYDMLIAFGQTQFNPTLNWNYKKISFNVKNYEECNIKKFLSEIDTTTFAGLRDHTMCLFIIDTGIRPSEVVQLKKEDVDQTAGQVHLRSEITKTRVARTVPVSNFVLRAIRKLQSYEPEDWSNKFLFCTSEGKQLSTLSFRHNLHKVALKSGINLTPYDFRHIFATTYIRNGGDAFTLQRIMGHTKPSMTMIYVNLNPTDLSIVHNKVNVIGNYIGKRLSTIS